MKCLPCALDSATTRGNGSNGVRNLLSAVVDEQLRGLLGRFTNDGAGRTLCGAVLKHLERKQAAVC